MLQGLLAQYGLARSEVERWMQANASDNNSSVSGLMNSGARGPQVKEWATPSLHAPSPHSASTGCQAQPQWPTGQGSCGNAAIHAAASIQQRQHPSQYDLPTGGAVDKLQAFEARVRWVAARLETVRKEANILRMDDRLDPNRLDSILGLLHAGSMHEQLHPLRGITRTSEPCGRSPANQLQDPVEDVDANTRLQSDPRARVNRRRNHRQDQLAVLRRWFEQHAEDPYPSPEEKSVLAAHCGMEVRQIEHWFTNRRKRHWNKKLRGSPDDHEQNMMDFEMPWADSQ